MGYKIARLMINLFIRLTSRIQVDGLEHLPESGGYMVASNHLGRLDAILAYYFVDRDDIIMLAAEKYQKSALARWFARQLDAIWVDRFNADFSAARQALKRLRAGGVLVLAPEGTRSKTEALSEAWPGASYMAAKAGAPIVPVALMGSEDSKVFPRWKRLKRAQVIVRAGAPFVLPPIPKQKREQAVQDYTDEIMCRIAALLEPPYRGVYAEHPRLKELLAEAGS
ncbi:MAG: 1-acyl-sn-glycerol-3-phosphate acyltransferase [Anaerolineales bacterium]|nr:1-acyl-sn-glycerol-3-phosphate acyltransferase [Anaerolineales bacterium]